MTLRRWHKAVLEDDLALLQEACAKGILQEELDENGYSPIDYAHLFNKRDCLKALGLWIPNQIQIIPKSHTSIEVYEDKEIEEKLGFQCQSTLVFDSYDSFLEALQNRPYIHKRFKTQYQSTTLPNLYVKWVNDTIEYGLYTEAFIPKGTAIGEYTGTVKSASMYDAGDYYFYYPQKYRWKTKPLTDDKVIDAHRFGNLLRYVNHSDSPNLDALWAKDRKLLHLFFVAASDIPPHTQLTVSYGKDYFFPSKLSNIE
jgi:uncharacterized protein